MKKRTKKGRKKGETGISLVLAKRHSLIGQVSLSLGIDRLGQFAQFFVEMAWKIACLFKGDCLCTILQHFVQLWHKKQIWNKVYEWKLKTAKLYAEAESDHCTFLLKIFIQLSKYSTFLSCFTPNLIELYLKEIQWITKLVGQDGHHQRYQSHLGLHQNWKFNKNANA